VKGFGHDIPWRPQDLHLEPGFERFQGSILWPTGVIRSPAPERGIEEKGVILPNPIPCGLGLIEKGYHEGDRMLNRRPQLLHALPGLAELLSPHLKGLLGVQKHQEPIGIPDLPLVVLGYGYNH
jgi:hypothetical protein